MYPTIRYLSMYLGPANGDMMLESFMRCKEPGVKELSDTSFEHLTQVYYLSIHGCSAIFLS